MNDKIKNILDLLFHVLKGVIFLVLIFLAYIAFIPNAWKRKMNEKEIYRNEKLLIVGTNEAAQDFTHDKFHRPIVIKVWLVQRVKDTTQFAELNSLWDDNNFYITKELWYSKSIGDTLYFDYIRKGRFFTIKK
jgi:cbb3-type cytochrome oxidase subunit 3